MAAKKELIWILLIIVLTMSSGQYIENNSSMPLGICIDVYCNSVESISRIKDCIVIVGNLSIVLLESATKESYTDLSLPNLREVTGYVVFYRLSELDSLGKLLPNLARIRGQSLIYNYALIIHDMTDLKEVGLYNLIKIDRGGVNVWGGPHTCFVNTIDWNAIAPLAPLMLTTPDTKVHCDFDQSCQCGKVTSKYCWNSRHCQRFFKEEDCHPQCLGCFQEDRNKCLLCRNFTFRKKCVASCPPNTIILPANQYCVTIEQCRILNGWDWNGTCWMSCPVGFKQTDTSGRLDCRMNTFRSSADKIVVCPSITITSLNGIQRSGRCTHINGSLTIHVVKTVPKIMDELSNHLRGIQVVNDFVQVYYSETVTSLEFLSSLREIKGKNLKNGYSLIIHDMMNLRGLFTSDVVSNLNIHRGKLNLYRNPKLCMNAVNEISDKFTESISDIDIPLGMNGYSGGCLENELRFKVKAVGSTDAFVSFTRIPDVDATYTILYIRYTGNDSLVPECCKEGQWSVKQVDLSKRSHRNKVLITDLRPASTYIICIEVYVQSENAFQSLLARSDTKNFTTSFLKPAPPFVIELSATSPNSVFVRWVDHIDYRHSIIYHELDVKLVEIPPKDLKVRNHCEEQTQHFYSEDKDDSVHYVTSVPTADYCDRTFSSEPENVFDMICSKFDEDCNNEEPAPKNTSFGKYIRTQSLNITGPRSEINVEGLAPFRDYRFRLRSCVGICSISTRNIIKTLSSKEADVPVLTHYDVNETGHITIKWEPPDVTNGPVLKYYVQILPLRNFSSSIPSLKCVLFDTLNMTVRSLVSKQFNVSVCTTSLGSSFTCSDWKTVSVPTVKMYRVLYSFIFSIFLVTVSFVIGYIYHRRRITDDDGLVQLVDMTSSYRNHSDPPSVTLTDFMPFYSVPLTESLLND